MTLGTRSGAAVAVAILFAAASGPSFGADCNKEVRDPRVKRLKCHVEAAAEGPAAAEIKKTTAGLIDAYHCTFDLDITLDALDEGRSKAEPVAVPGQPFTCDVTAVGSQVHAAGKVAATVTSKDGKVTDVAMRLDDLTGVKGLVSKTVKLVLASKKVRAQAADAVEQILAERAGKKR